jgi:hypothetical protein
MNETTPMANDLDDFTNDFTQHAKEFNPDRSAEDVAILAAIVKKILKTKAKIVLKLSIDNQEFINLTLGYSGNPPF